MSRLSPQTIAESLLADRKALKTLKALGPDDGLTSLNDAYLVQDCLLALATEDGAGPIGGWKVALTTPVMQQLVGVDHPGEGAIFRKLIRQSPTAIAEKDYVRLAVEAEIAVSLSQDIDDPHMAAGPETIRDAIETCMAAIEIVDDRAIPYDTFNATTLVADNAMNYGCVLGPAVRDWQSLEMQSLAGSMRINGETTGTGISGDVMGHPFEALAWLARNLIARGRYLRKGDIVMTGSVVKTEWPKAGDEVVAEIEGLGVASLAVT